MSCQEVEVIPTYAGSAVFDGTPRPIDGQLPPGVRFTTLPGGEDLGGVSYPPGQLMVAF